MSNERDVTDGGGGWIVTVGLLLIAAGFAWSVFEFIIKPFFNL